MNKGIKMFSALNPSSTLGSVAAATQQQASSQYLATTSPQVNSLSTASKPAPIYRTPAAVNQSPLIVQSSDKGTVTVYNDEAKSKEALLVSPTGYYFGSNVASRLPLQPRDPSSGTSRKVLALDGNFVLVNPTSTVSARQPLTYDAATGRVVVVQSSLKYKKNVQDLAKDLDVNKLFRDLEVKSYEDSRLNTGEREYGLIAEALATAYPQLVNKDNEGTLTSVRYDVINVLAIEKIKHLQEQVDRLEKKLEQLSSK